MAAFVKEEAGIDIGLDATGRIGEFTVLINGKVIQKKERLKFPDKHKILNAIQQKLQPES